MTGLPSSAYFVNFRNDAAAISERYDNLPLDFSQLSQGTPVTVTAPFTTTGINATLERGAVVSGTVLDALSGQPVPGVFVEVVSTRNSRIESGFTNASGRYQLNPSIASGAYRVQFSAQESNTSCIMISEYHNDAPTFEGATPITMTAGMTYTVDATLNRGSLIFGRVTDAAGTPLTSNSPRIFTSTTTTRSVMSGRNTVLGIYHSSTALPAGTYFVGQTGSDGYLDTYYNGKATLSEADPVVLAPPTHASGIDLVMQRGGSISGRVTTGDGGVPFVYGTVAVYKRRRAARRHFGHFIC